MNETNWFLHPTIWFFATALLVPFFPVRYFRWVLPVPALLAIISVVTADPGQYWHVRYLGLDLVFGRVDQLSTIFAHVFAIQALIGIIFAFHLKDKNQHIAALLYVGGAFGCVFTGDYLTLLIFWEIMSVASTFLIWLNRNPKSTSAGFRYFLFHTLGGLLLFGGLLLRYKALGTFAFDGVNPADLQLYDYLIMAGFCVNAAVVPLHAWLPDAYPEATVTGAVFMSAFTTKTAVYVLARSFAGAEILAIAGVIMALYGVFYATIENNARRILAYHIVSQVGYMVAGIGIGTAMTVNGATCHAYAHILYKGLLFMSAGTILYATGTAKLTELGGLVRKLPLVFIFYMVAAVSISGMPFFNGFISKTMTIAGAAGAGRTWLALGMEVAAIGTFLSVGLKLPYFAFFAKPENTTLKIKPVPFNMYLGMFMGAALCFITGIFPSLLYKLLPFTSDAVIHSHVYVTHITDAIEKPYTPYTLWHLIQSFMLLGATGLGFWAMVKLNIIPPHAKLNLDFEWFYRLGGKAFYNLVSRPVAFLDGIWTEVYKTVGLKFMWLMGRITSVFDKKGIDGVLDNSVYAVGEVGHGAAKISTGKLQSYVAGTLILALGLFALVWYLLK